jgi:four helix bundle protein
VQRFEISSQINRSARNTDKEFKRYLDFTLGLAFELETQLIITSRTIELEKDIVNNKIIELQEIQKMIKAFKGSLN